MKKIFSLFLLCGSFALSLTSCMDKHDEPYTDEYILTCDSVGEVNTTIAQVKQRFCASNKNADFSRNASNFFTKVNEDLIIDGVVVANDVSGKLYQTLMIRNIDAKTGEDQCFVVAIKNTCLYPYFALGQRIKVNLKNLYVGCYSKVPRVGQPYYSSQGNLNLGPMLLDMCRTNIELVGTPDLNAPELVPEDLTDADGEAWLRASANKTYLNTPRLAKVRGKIKEMQNGADKVAEKGENSGKYEPLPKLFAPEELYDDGYGVDRTIQLQTNTSSVALRTSTQNAISFLPLPSGVCTYTGMLTYYDSWQIQLRSVEDFEK